MQRILKKKKRNEEGRAGPLHRLQFCLPTPCPLPFTPYSTPQTLHPTPYTLHPKPYTLNPRPWTLHPGEPCTASYITKCTTCAVVAYHQVYNVYYEKKRWDGPLNRIVTQLSLLLSCSLYATHRIYLLVLKSQLPHKT